MNENNNEKWIGIEEAAEYLGVKSSTLREWIKEWMKVYKKPYIYKEKNFFKINFKKFIYHY